MAKLSAPLFSFEARGQVAKSLVYFPWKGLSVVRKHVVPTNPKSAKQVIQRNYVKAAVTAIHNSLADSTKPINSADKQAMSLYASAIGVIMTWFNMLLKLIVDQLVAGKYWCIYSGGVVTEASTQLTLALSVTQSVGGDPTSGKIWYGLSKTSMINSVACTVADLSTGKAVTGLTNGTKYYLQFKPLLSAEYIGCNSGIYTGIPSA